MAKTYEDTPTGQIRVETGRGRIAAVRLEDGRRNGQVTIRADHLREDVKAWADSHDGQLWNKIVQAHSGGQPITYRIEVKRKANADRTTPIDDLGNREKARDLAQVYLDGEAPAQQPAQQPAPPRQQQPAQPPPEDPDLPDPIKPNNPRVLRILAHTGPIAIDWPADTDLGVPERERTAASFQKARREGAVAVAFMLDVLDAQRATLRPQTAPAGNAERSDLPARALAGHVDPDRIATPPAPPEPPAEPPVDDGREVPPPQREVRPGARLQEGKAWEFYNSDGTINLGSYAMTAVVGVVGKATKLLLARNEERHHAGETPAVEHPHRDEVIYLSRMLLWVCDRVQADVRSDHRVDRGANSHTRCRGAVFSALDRHPVPWHELEDQAARDAWLAQLRSYAVDVLEIAIDLLKA